jgi:hypothetical protein
MQECLQQNDSPLTLLAGSRSVANGNSMHAFRLRRPITSYRRSECLYILYVVVYSTSVQILESTKAHRVKRHGLNFNLPPPF